jgi:micrococcal nuclease
LNYDILIQPKEINEMTHIRKAFLTIFITVTSLLIFISLLPAKSPIRIVEGIVVKVTDGDTIQVKTPEGTILKVRLYGIDAPETEKYSRRTGRISKAGQPYGEGAYRALESKVLDKRVRVDIVDIDRYKRMVGIVSFGNRNINLEMVKEGWAWAYKEYLQRPYASEYIDAEKEARSKGLRLWQQRNPMPPWEFRKLMRIR